MESLENGLQPHSGATSLFSMRTGSLASPHHRVVTALTLILGPKNSRETLPDVRIYQREKSLIQCTD